MSKIVLKTSINGEEREFLADERDSRLDALRLRMEDGIGRLLDPALGREEAR